MHAVVQISGFQFRVEKDQVIKVPLQTAAEGDTLTLDKVLLLAEGDSVRVGTPVVEGASVSAKVLGHGRTKKLRAGRFKRRKDYRRTWGHRQDYTELQIGAIQG